MPNLYPLVYLEPFKKLGVVGGWVVKRHFRVPLWAKACPELGTAQSQIRSKGGGGGEKIVLDLYPLVCLDHLKTEGWVVKRHFRVPLWAKDFGFG